jgi:hypothetical protein
MSKQIDQETAEIQRTVRLLMSTVIMAALLARGSYDENVAKKAVDLTDDLITANGGMPL